MPVSCAFLRCVRAVRPVRLPRDWAGKATEAGEKRGRPSRSRKKPWPRGGEGRRDSGDAIGPLRPRNRVRPAGLPGAASFRRSRMQFERRGHGRSLNGIEMRFHAPVAEAARAGLALLMAAVRELLANRAPGHAGQRLRERVLRQVADALDALEIRQQIITSPSLSTMRSLTISPEQRIGIGASARSLNTVKVLRAAAAPGHRARPCGCSAHRNEVLN